MDRREDNEISYMSINGQVFYTATSYLLEFALPNFFFHSVMTYALLRKMGVPVGKWDILGPARKTPLNQAA